MDSLSEPTSCEPSWVSVVDRFIVYCRDEARMSAHSVRAYSADLTLLSGFVERAGVSTVAEISTPLLRAWVSDMVADGAARSSVARRVSSVRSLWRWAVETGRTTTDPTGRLTLPKKQPTLPQVPTAPDVFQAISDLQSTVADTDDPVVIRDVALLELLYGAGLRVSELVQLDVCDVDCAALTVKVLGKGNKERIVPIGKPAAHAVDHYVRQVRSSVMKNTQETALFLGVKGRRIDPRIVRKVVVNALKGHAASKQLAPHSLRHAAATHMLDGGADLRTVQEQLGHASLASTQIYTHVSIERLKVAFNQGHPRA